MNKLFFLTVYNMLKQPVKVVGSTPLPAMRNYNYHIKLDAKCNWHAAINVQNICKKLYSRTGGYCLAFQHMSVYIFIILYSTVLQEIQFFVHVSKYTVSGFPSGFCESL